MTKAIVPGKLLVRNAYRLLGRRSSRDSPLLLDGPTRDDLTRWYHALESWNARPIKTKTSRSSTRHWCFTNRMGSSSQWKAGNRLSGQTSSAHTFKLTRVVGHPSSNKSFRERLKVQKKCKCYLTTLRLWLTSTIWVAPSPVSRPWLRQLELPPAS